MRAGSTIDHGIQVGCQQYQVRTVIALQDVLAVVISDIEYGCFVMTPEIILPLAEVAKIVWGNDALQMFDTFERIIGHNLDNMDIVESALHASWQ